MTYSQILGVQTRSMVRKEAIKQEASYKKLILTTPGIITQIANQLSIDDIDLKVYFYLLMINIIDMNYNHSQTLLNKIILMKNKKYK